MNKQCEVSLLIQIFDVITLQTTGTPELLSSGLSLAQVCTNTGRVEPCLLPMPRYNTSGEVLLPLCLSWRTKNKEMK